MASDIVNVSTAAELKDEGNKLFVAKKYGQASRKYSDAIAKDASNAVLYANRAACALNLQQYGEAERDARKSSELDPGYSKAWARLATAQQALNNMQGSMFSWQKAMETLPAQPSPAEAIQKEQYKTNLMNVIKAQHEWEQKAKDGPSVLVMKDGNTMPWDVAAEMMPDLIAKGPAGYRSSAWVVHEARRDWNEGLGIIDKMIIRGQNMQAFTGAIELLSNAVMIDERVFNLRNEKFIEQYNRQMMCEANTYKSWTSGEAAEVIREAPARLAREGWHTLRGALSLTVRANALKAHILAGVTKDCDKAERLQSEALKICEWGAKKWANVDFEDKGVIFRPSFIVGLKSMRLETYRHVRRGLTIQMGRTGGSRRFTLKEFYELSTELQKESITQEQTMTEVSPGFLLAFHLYPQVRAVSCVGFYHKLCASAKKGPAAEEHLQQAGKMYMTAADLLPDDEEMHSFFLNTTLGCFFATNEPLKVTMPLMRRIRAVAPKMQKLWVNSALQRAGRDLILDTTAMREKEIQERIDKGELTLNDRYCPPDL